LSVEIARPHELGPAELEAWRRMQRGAPEFSNPFLAPEFACALGRARGDVRVAVLRDGGEITGFLPYHQRRFGVGLALRPADAQALVHAPGRSWHHRELLAASGLSVLEFDHLLAGHVPFPVGHARAVPSPIIDLSDGYAGYLEQRARASERMRVALRKGRKAARELGDLRFEFDVRERAQLDPVMRWKSAQYRRTGRADRFAHAWITQLLDDLFAQRAPGCTGTLSLLWAGERLLAGHFGLRSERVLASWYPAYDVTAARYSPGWLLFLHMAEAAAERGVQQLDLGKGDEAYKQSLKTGDLALAEGWVQRRSAQALARAAVREPRRRALRFVLERPRLRLAARRLLREVGRARAPA
jgi:CelD/BcsL family acetyltransferase involved in cellulose biosynthesis